MTSCCCWRFHGKCSWSESKGQSGTVGNVFGPSPNIEKYLQLRPIKWIETNKQNWSNWYKLIRIHWYNQLIWYIFRWSSEKKQNPGLNGAWHIGKLEAPWLGQELFFWLQNHPFFSCVMMIDDWWLMMFEIQNRSRSLPWSTCQQGTWKGTSSLRNVQRGLARSCQWWPPYLSTRLKE